MSTRGRALLADRYVNKSTAFSTAERKRFGLDGLLPPVVEDLETPLERVTSEYDLESTDLGRHVFLRALQDRNSVLFYAFLERHLAELLPAVYTPTVGLACQQWSRIHRRERGLFLSWPLRDRVDELLAAGGGLDPARTPPVLLDVGTDNEALLSDPLYLDWRHQRVRGDEYETLNVSPVIH